MKTSSAKAKGHSLERLICNKVKEAFNLSIDDIRITISGEQGADIKLSTKAKTLFPFSVEAKARKSFDTLYGFYEQAQGHHPELIPLVVIKGNYKRPLVLLDLDHFLTISQVFTSKGKRNA